MGPPAVPGSRGHGKGRAVGVPDEGMILLIMIFSKTFIEFTLFMVLYFTMRNWNNVGLPQGTFW
jgi:hypothetical protein